MFKLCLQKTGKKIIKLRSVFLVLIKITMAKYILL